MDITQIKDLTVTELEDLLSSTNLVDKKERYLLAWLSNKNDNIFALSKITEEAIEVSEAAIKMINKSPSYKPPIENLLAEFSDLTTRLMLFLNSISKDSEELEKYLDMLSDMSSAKVRKIYSYIKAKNENT